MKHILVDLDGLKVNDLERVYEPGSRVWLFFGASRKEVALPLVELLCRIGTEVRFIRMERRGKSTLNFYLNFYISRIAFDDPEAQITILSRGKCHLADLPEGSHEQFQAAFSKPSDNAQEISLLVLDDKLTDLFLKKAVGYFLRPDAEQPPTHEGLRKCLKKLLRADLKALSKPTRKQCLAKLGERLQTLQLIQDHDGVLTYHFQAEDWENRLIDTIKQQAPNTITKLHNLIRKQIEPLLHNTWDSVIGDNIIDRLMEHRIITVDNDTIEYPAEPIPVHDAATINTNDTTTSNTLSAQAETVIRNLAKMTHNRPTRHQTLLNAICSWTRFRQPEAENIINELTKAHYLSVENEQVCYHCL